MARVLIVDDESSIRTILKEFLTVADYDFSEVGNTDQAIALLAKEDFDVVLTDIIMPQITGLDLLKSIKETSPNVEVILMTGQPSVETASEAIRAGAADYLSKPFTMEELLKSVAKAARIKALSNDLQRLEHENIEHQNSLELLVKERTAALVNSEERFRTLFDYSPDALYLNDLKGNFIDGNKAAEKITGYTKHELIGESFLSLNLLPPNQIIKASKLLAMNLAGKSTGPDELTLKRKDGSKIELEIQTFPMRIQNRALVLGSARELTERKRAELELKLPEQKYKSLLDFSPDIILLADLKGFILEINNAVDHYLGYPLNDIVGKHFTKLRFLKARDLPKYIAILKSLARGETPAPFDTEVKHKDGSVLFLEIYITILNISDRAPLLQVIAHDITSRKLAEEALKRSRNRSTALLKAIPDLMFRLNDEGVYLDYKAAKNDLYVTDSKSIIGKRNRDITPPAFSDLVDEKISETLASGEMQTFEYQLKVHERGMRDFEARMVKSDEDEVIAIVRDITERKQTEVALSDSEEKYRLIVENANDGIEVSQNNRIVYSNTRFADMLGYTVDEITGLSFKRIYNEQAKRDLKERTRNKKSKGIESNMYESTLQQKAGGIIDVEVKYEITEFKGKPATFAIARDITKHKLAEVELMVANEKIKKSENYLDSIINNIGDPVFVKDNDKRFHLVNDAFCKLLDLEREKILGKTLTEDFPPDEMKHFFRIDDLVLSEGIENVSEEMLTFRGRQTKTISTKKSRFIDSQGEKFLIGIIHDISERKEAEDSLRISENRYTQLAEQSLTVAWEIDAEGLYIYVSKVAEKVWGYLPEDIVGKLHFYDLHPKKGRKTFQKAAFEVFAQKESFFELENQIQKRDGELIWVSTNGFPILDPNGILLSYQGSDTDISDRKQVKTDLVENEEKYRVLVESLKEGIGKVDENESFTFVNQAAADIFGFSTKEMIGKNLKDFISARAFDQIQEQTAKRKTGYSSKYELEIIREIGANRIIEVNATPIESEQQEYQGTFAIFHDITERKIAEEALKESEEKFRTLFTTMEQGVVYQDSKGNITHANKAAETILGLSLDQMLGKTSMNPEWRAVGKDMVELPGDKHPAMIALKTGKTIKNFLLGIYNPVRKEYVWILVNATPQFDKDSKTPYQVYTTFLDITKRKKAEQEREQALKEAQSANKVKDQFIANISHEIRTPLNSILGFSDVLRQRYLDLFPEKDRKIFEYIGNSSNRLLDTVDSILNISQLEAGTVQTSPVEMDLNLVTRQVVDQLTPKAEDKHLSLQLIKLKQPMLIFADQYCIQQAVLNLVGNAIKYTHEGHVKIELDNNDSQAKMIIKDSGIGISEEYQKRMFTAYSQESEGFTKNYQGVGLGLTLTKRYLDLNDVELELVSQKNVGSTFTLIFPKYERGS